MSRRAIIQRSGITLEEYNNYVTEIDEELDNITRQYVIEDTRIVDYFLCNHTEHIPLTYTAFADLRSKYENNKYYLMVHAYIFKKIAGRFPDEFA